MTLGTTNLKFVISNRMYEKYCSYFDQMELKADSFSPDIEVIQKEVLPDLEDNIIFLLWIDETGFETSSNRESRAFVRDILRNCLVITD